MASEVEICNRALQKLGAKRITSLVEDSRNARSCNVAYAPLRDSLLRSSPWNFAIKRATLAEDAVVPEWGRAHSVQLPSDFLYLMPPYPEFNLNSLDWQIEGQKILTNDTPPLEVRYVAQITDPNMMDPLFREALSCKIAFELCEELTQSNQKKVENEEAFEKAISEAKLRNAIENVAQVPPDDEWITVRM